MHQTFATPAEVTDAFTASVATGSAVVAIMAVTAMVVVWAHDRNAHAKPILLLAAAGLGIVVGIAWWANFDRFVTADATASGLELGYTGPFAQRVVLSLADVDTILVGTAGKLQRRCHLRVVAKSKRTYRSADIEGDLATCRQVRQKMLEATGAAR